MGYATIHVYGSEASCARTRGATILAVQAASEGKRVLLTENGAAHLRLLLPSRLVARAEPDLFTVTGFPDDQLVIALSNRNGLEEGFLDQLIADRDLLVCIHGKLGKRKDRAGQKNQVLVGGYDGLLLQDILHLAPKLENTTVIAAVSNHKSYTFDRMKRRATSKLPALGNGAFEMALLNYSFITLPDEGEPELWQASARLLAQLDLAPQQDAAGQPNPALLDHALPTDGSGSERTTELEPTPAPDLTNLPDTNPGVATAVRDSLASNADLLDEFQRSQATATAQRTSSVTALDDSWQAEHDLHAATRQERTGILTVAGEVLQVEAGEAQTACEEAQAYGEAIAERVREEVTARQERLDNAVTAREEVRQAAEEHERLEKLRLQAEEEERLAVLERERVKAEEHKRLEKLRLQAEEEERLAALERERIKAEEHKRLEELRLQAEEEERLAALKRERIKAEEHKRLEELRLQAEEEERLATLARERVEAKETTTVEATNNEDGQPVASPPKTPAGKEDADEPDHARVADEEKRHRTTEPKDQTPTSRAAAVTSPSAPLGKSVAAKKKARTGFPLFINVAAMLKQMTFKEAAAILEAEDFGKTYPDLPPLNLQLDKGLHQQFKGIIEWYRKQTDKQQDNGGWRQAVLESFALSKRAEKNGNHVITKVCREFGAEIMAKHEKSDFDMLMLWCGNAIWLAHFYLNENKHEPASGVLVPLVNSLHSSKPLFNKLAGLAHDTDDIFNMFLTGLTVVAAKVEEINSFRHNDDSLNGLQEMAQSLQAKLPQELRDTVFAGIKQLPKRASPADVQDQSGNQSGDGKGNEQSKASASLAAARDAFGDM